MRDYWLTQYLLAGVGWIYIIATLIAIALALWFPKGKKAKVEIVALVIGLASILPIQGFQEYRKEREAGEAYRVRLAKAQALFSERCKTAGEKIYKTVENVESVLLKNTRGKHRVSNYVKQDWEGAGFPGESSGNQYIMEFVYYNTPAHGDYGRDLSPTQRPNGLRGYLYVEVEEVDGRYRYTLGDPLQFGPPSAPDKVAGFGSRELSKAPAPSYVVSYENIDDPEGRAFWIAGGHVKVIDQRSGEVLGEFIRYAFERGFGNSSGERSAWAFATQCPLSSYGGASGHIRSFVEQVLKPIQGK